MAGIEKIVRPFVARDISPPKNVYAGSPASDSANATCTDPVVLKWGESGSCRSFHGSVEITETFYAVKKMREKPKTT